MARPHHNEYGSPYGCLRRLKLDCQITAPNSVTDRKRHTGLRPQSAFAINHTPLPRSRNATGVVASGSAANAPHSAKLVAFSGFSAQAFLAFLALGILLQHRRYHSLRRSKGSLTQPVEHRRQIHQSAGCRKIQYTKRAYHGQSTRTGGTYPVPLIHHQKADLEFGGKRYGFTLSSVEVR